MTDTTDTLKPMELNDEIRVAKNGGYVVLSEHSFRERGLPSTIAALSMPADLVDWIEEAVGETYMREQATLLLKQNAVLEDQCAALKTEPEETDKGKQRLPHETGHLTNERRRQIHQSQDQSHATCGLQARTGAVGDVCPVHSRRIAVGRVGLGAGAVATSTRSWSGSRGRRDRVHPVVPTQHSAAHIHERAARHYR